MTTSTSAGRWRRALFGASVGLVAATALLLAELPLIRGHAFAIVGLGTVVGAAIGFFQLWIVAAWCMVPIAALTGLIVATPITTALVRPLIRTDSIPSRPLDAVVVLSADVNLDGVLNVQGTERLLSGVRLARENHSRLLITTRIGNGKTQPPVYSDADQKAIVALAGDPAPLRITEQVHSTHDEALGTMKVLPPGPDVTIAVVTSPAHTRRACATFETVGYRVVCVPSESRSLPIHHLDGPVPRFHAFFDWVYERLGMLEYRWRGWIKP